MIKISKRVTLLTFALFAFLLANIAHSRISEINALITENDNTDNYSNEMTISDVTCNGVACMITNVCVHNNTGVSLFGGYNHFMEQKEKLKYIKKQAYACPQCVKNVLVERAKGRHYFHDSTVTLAAGLHNSNCGHQIGDVIWPLIRLNTKFRKIKDVINNGLGVLFVQTPEFHCNQLFKSIAETVSIYDEIPENGMCFRKVLVGTGLENYSSSWQGIVKENFSRDMKAMRSLYYKAYNVREKQNMDIILILLKQGGSHILNIHNIHEIVDMLQAEFPTYKVVVSSWEDYSMKEQLKLLARTRLLISLPGAALMNAAFLPDDSAVISFCRGKKKSAGVEYRYWFDNLDYGTFLQYCKKDAIKIIGQNTYVHIPKLKENIKKLRL